MSKPTVPELVPQIRTYYRLPGNSVGGSLHIILDDGNVSDGHVQWCVKHAHQIGDAEGERLAGLLLQMSRTQRSRLAGMNFYPWAQA